MKKILIFAATLVTMNLSAQEFDKNIGSAKSSYAAGNLENARFAMEQVLRDLDMSIGKEILKLLPSKMGSVNANSKDDNVTGSGAGYAGGLYVHRTYGVQPKMIKLDIINNSPMIAGINAMLSLPFITGDQNQKQVKVQGYKSLLKKVVNTENNKTDYELQIPFGNTLLTLKVDDTNETEILDFGNLIPLAKIAEMAQ